MGKVDAITFANANMYWNSGFAAPSYNYGYSSLPYMFNIPFSYGNLSYSQPSLMNDLNIGLLQVENSFMNFLYGYDLSQSNTQAARSTSVSRNPLLSVTSGVKSSPHIRRNLSALSFHSNPLISGSYTNSSETISAYISRAMSYDGMKNTNEQCNKLFSPSNYRTAGDNWYTKHGNKWAWCVDFARWNAEQTFGDKLPKGMSSSVYGVMKWGTKNDCYTVFPKSSVDVMKNFAINNIKPGNILLMDGRRYNKETGKWYTTEYGHVAIVTGVNPVTGEITTIEGNVSNSVGVRHYKKDDWHRLTGVVSLEKFA